MSPVETVLLDGFDDPRLDSDIWTSLLRVGPTQSINLSYPWLRTWWEFFGHGRLLLVGARRQGRWTALAPLFTDGGMIYNLCPEDQLDLLGDVTDPETISALLQTARAAVPEFLGFTFYFIPESSPTTALLPYVLQRWGLSRYEAGVLPSPYLDLKSDPERALAQTRKTSLLRHERALRKVGPIEIRHFKNSSDILPQLDSFFDQHVARRALTPHPSLFTDERQREYYRAQTRVNGPLGHLRFSRLDCAGKPVAYHYGLSYLGRFLFGIPSFDIQWAQYSPGEVLLRHLLLAAIEEGARHFDFGLGDEKYKYRFASGSTWLRTWGFHQK